ncbi:MULTISPECIES: condensation domain-containing protein [unclassified Rhizobium]|uniref:condensation domain-containing protein n=1 Tax=unclassified Rhizobium TaxID=2613769 RepID=UPI000EAA64E6|nr:MULTISPECIES: condensation domain-containing protein [unclassified Rhizobium]AYG69905.1 condensation protein [Rhizobium sp. CCGE531]AYG76285.1 condensation protein [Rhizobium sp. CCGE532]
MSTVDNSPSGSLAEPQIIGEFPCTQTQLRCWILDQLNPGNPALNVAVRWEIRGSFKVVTLEAAFRKVIQRHEILRTRFIEKSGRPFQQAVGDVNFKMSVIDLRGMPPEQRQARILSIGEETAQAPFDLSTPGLFRVTLLMAENERGFLLITAHQSCFDGWSIRVLGREVGEIAAAIDAGRAPVLPELPLQYGDYALWQQEYLESYGFETEKAFWRETMQGAPYFEVAPDRPRGQVKTNRGDILSTAQAPAFTDRMDAAARTHCVSQYSFGAAVLSAALHRLTQAPTVLFGSQIAGREQSDLEDLIGVFINNLVLRFDFGSDTSFAEHIRSVSATIEGALNHQRMPFNKLVELVNPVRDPARNPLISVNFNLQKAFLEDRRYGGFELISSPSQSPGVIYDLSFIMIGRPTGWRMSIEYNADLFEASTIESLLQLWRNAYEIALDHPEAPLSSLAAPERHLAASAEVAPLDGAVTSKSPADTRMEALAELWKEVLQVPQIRPDDDFFALGGHSLLALRLLSEIRARFEAAPTLQLLFKQPTFAGFAAAIFNVDPTPAAQEKSVNPWELITCKHGTGAGTVYTLNHPFLYYRLANELPDSVSVHNVNMFHADLANGLDRLSIEDIASRAIDAMRIDKAVGRVAIVGLCVNGILALEVGRQLQERGIDVGTTAIIDAWAPGFFVSLPKREQARWNRERRRKRLAYFTRKLLSGRIRLIDYLKEFEVSLSLLRIFGVKAGQYSPEEEANEAVTKLLVASARRYKPPQTKDPSIVLLRSSATNPRARKLRFGWGDAIGDDCPVVDIDGWHEDSLTSNGIRDLASTLSGKLAGG